MQFHLNPRASVLDCGSPLLLFHSLSGESSFDLYPSEFICGLVSETSLNPQFSFHVSLSIHILENMQPRFRARILVAALITSVILLSLKSRAETISIVIASNATPRVQFGAEKLAEALKSLKLNATVVRSDTKKLSAVMSAQMPEENGGRKIYISRLRTGWERESFVVSQRMDSNNMSVMANDDSGVLYGCLELARRIRAAGKLPEGLDIHDGPKMTLRGT